MHTQTIKEIVDEIRAALVGRSVGSVFQLDGLTLAIDFRSRDKDFLLLSVDPARPRLYLISKPQLQLEKQVPVSAFAQAIRSNLANGKLQQVNKDENERIVRFKFRCEDATGEDNERVLVAQLTGRSANLILLDEDGTILHSFRSLKGKGQQTGEEYAPPPNPAGETVETAIQKNSFASLSAAAAAFYQALEAELAFEARAAGAQARVRQEIARLNKLRKHLENDLVAHGDPEQHKRRGDLLLANIATAERRGNKTWLTDFYTEGAPKIEIEVDEHTSLQDEAGRHFARFSKAKRARQKIGSRLEESQEKLAELALQQLAIEQAIATRDEGAMATLIEARGPKTKHLAAAQKDQTAEKIPGTRRYLSSDGYEILVGRAAKDNDHLTFRVARPYDLWLHAADYPGSHVIVQNPKRLEVPHRTLVEAAQLAAKFSQAGKDSKVNVHHTQRKFVSKIKGAAPGLVRLSSFKTITVQPGEPIERI